MNVNELEKLFQDDEWTPTPDNVVKEIKLICEKIIQKTGFDINSRDFYDVLWTYEDNGPYKSRSEHLKTLDYDFYSWTKHNKYSGLQIEVKVFNSFEKIKIDVNTWTWEYE